MIHTTDLLQHEAVEFFTSLPNLPVGLVKTTTTPKLLNQGQKPAQC